MTQTNNVFLTKFSTPFETIPFHELKNEMFLPAFHAAIAQAMKEVEEIKNNSAKANFENTILALENLNPQMDVISSAFFNLLSAETSEELQQLAKIVSPLLSKFSNDINLDPELFNRVKAVYDSVDKKMMDAEDLKLLENTYKNFVRSGALLNDSDKNEFRKISEELSLLGLSFGDNVLKESQQFEMLLTNSEDLRGLPQREIEAALALAEAKNYSTSDKPAWLITLDYPSYIPFMTYAQNRELRKKLFMAQSTKAFKGNDLDNKKNILKIVQLRSKMAQLLGHKTYADFILEERMASKPETVFEFLNNLLGHAQLPAQKETDELKAFALKCDGIHDLQKWDIAYYLEKLKEEKFDFDDEALRPYFLLENVIKGVFQVSEKLFGLNFKLRTDIPTYHPEVLTYEVLNAKNNQHVAVLYADFHPRAGKRSGAWMTQFRGQKNQNNFNVRPHVSIVCNFTKSTKDTPSLLSFNEVQTLFHEFGHALHGMLSEVKYASLSGTNVYWDFVELPSQILENWAYEKECLDLFAKHYQTGESIPSDLIEKLKKSSTFMEGRATLRQLAFALLDMKWHSQVDAEKYFNENFNIEHFEKETMEKTEFLPAIEGTAISSAFSHIFAGGYAAGYYSYKWAEVLDADAFSVFKKEGILNPKVGEKFKNTILSKGGSQHPMDLYLSFRGEKPDPKALLVRAGLL